MISHLGIDDLFVLIEAVLMERLGRTYRSQMPFASSSCCSTLTSWYFRKMTRIVN
ncbi:MAG: hypothetical protein ACLT98_11245 [Eggerthellaceae bacterium]